MSKLWNSITIKGHTIPNRVVMAPTVKFTMITPEGKPTEELFHYYDLVSKSGTGLVIVEATSVSPDGKIAPENLGLWDDSQIPEQQRIASSIHENGGICILQLCYAGKSTKDPSGRRYSASREYFMYPYAKGITEEISIEEIQRIEQDFADAAKRAVKAGYDGVELHCSHDKLFNQFHDALTNRRTDMYGVTFENRARIAVETIAKIRQVVPDNFIIGIRLGVNLPDFEDSVGIVDAFEKVHPDYYHFSKNIIPIADSKDKPEGFPCHKIVYDGSLLRKRVSVPAILSFGIAEPSQAEYIIDNDYGDLVSVGRGMLADFDWTRKAREGHPVNVCRHCTSCMWRIDHRKCPGYAASMQT